MFQLLDCLFLSDFRLLIGWATLSHNYAVSYALRPAEWTSNWPTSTSPNIHTTTCTASLFAKLAYFLHGSHSPSRSLQTPIFIFLFSFLDLFYILCIIKNKHKTNKHVNNNTGIPHIPLSVRTPRSHSRIDESLAAQQNHHRRCLFFKWCHPPYDSPCIVVHTRKRVQSRQGGSSRQYTAMASELTLSSLARYWLPPHCPTGFPAVPEILPAESSKVMCAGARAEER